MELVNQQKFADDSMISHHPKVVSSDASSCQDKSELNATSNYQTRCNIHEMKNENALHQNSVCLAENQADMVQYKHVSNQKDVETAVNLVLDELLEKITHKSTDNDMIPNMILDEILTNIITQIPFKTEDKTTNVQEQDELENRISNNSSIFEQIPFKRKDENSNKQEPDEEMNVVNESNKEKILVEKDKKNSNIHEQDKMELNNLNESIVSDVNNSTQSFESNNLNESIQSEEILPERDDRNTNVPDKMEICDLNESISSAIDSSISSSEAQMRTGKCNEDYTISKRSSIKKQKSPERITIQEIPDQHLTNKTLLFSQVKRLRRGITEKRETLRKLRLARLYKTKENAELDELTQKWTSASQKIILELVNYIEQTPKPTIGALLQYYNIDEKQIQYDKVKDAFYSVDDDRSCSF
ncbi:uncharacterized protein LOC120328254 [Styela clava]